MVEIVVEAEVRPTEDVEKVKKAVFAVITPDEVEVLDVGGFLKVIRAKSSRVESLEPLKKMARVQEAEPALRSYLIKYKFGNNITILLHKQAAFAGKMSLVDSDKESPLGPLRLSITGSEDELNRVVEFLVGESH